MIASYRLLGVLGGGGMGRVYLGQSPGGRRVAIKVVRSGLAEDPIFRERFAREVAAVRSVGPLITAAVVDADTEADLPWLASVYIDGPSLEQRVETHGPLSADAVLTLGAVLAEALSSIHRLGLVHRDLKPSNVLLDDAGAHIIDFGIAMTADDPRITQSVVVGTPSYMAPERIHSSEVGPAGDIFSLGATLVYAATGRTLVHDGNMYSQIVQITMGHFDLSMISDRLRPLIVRCVSHLPKDRPTAGELVRILVAAGAEAPVPGWYAARADHPDAGRPPTPRRTPMASASKASASMASAPVPTPRTPGAAVPGTARVPRRRALVVGGLVGAGLTAGAATAALLASRPPRQSGALQATAPATIRPGTVLWLAALGPTPLVPSRPEATPIPVIADAEGRIVSRTATDVYAVDRTGRPLWSHRLSDGLLDLRAWGNSLLASDAKHLWLVSAESGEATVFATAGGSLDEFRQLTTSTDRVFVNVATTIIALDRSGTPIWRAAGPAIAGSATRAGSPQAANGQWLVTHDTSLGQAMAQAALYDAMNGAAQWSTTYPIATAATVDTLPGRPDAAGGGVPPSDLWTRSQALVVGDLVVLRDAAQIRVVRVADGSPVWTTTSARPVAGIDIFGDTLLLCADRISGYAVDSGKALWQLPLRGAQTAISADRTSMIVASDDIIGAVDPSGTPRWTTTVPDALARMAPQSIQVSQHVAIVTYAARQPGVNGVGAGPGGGAVGPARVAGRNEETILAAVALDDEAR